MTIRIIDWHRPVDRKDGIYQWFAVCEGEVARLEIDALSPWLALRTAKYFYADVVVPQMMARARYRVWVAAHGCTPMPNPGVPWNPMWEPPA